MKKLIYKVAINDKDFDDFEAKASKNLNQGWKSKYSILQSRPTQLIYHIKHQQAQIRNPLTGIQKHWPLLPQSND